MKSSADVLDAINRLERAFPVASWRAGDIDLWPPYRLRLYALAVNALLTHEVPPGAIGRWRRLTDRAARALWRVPAAAWRDRRANAVPGREAAAVCLSDGMSFVRLGSAWYDRVVDPVLQAFDARGLRGLKLTPLSEAHVPRHRPSRFVQPTIDRIKLLAPLRHRPAMDVPGFDALAAAARASFGDLAPDRGWLQAQVARLDALATWFGRQIEGTSARFAFVNTWYSLEGQAFVQAARRAGLIAIDLQHGMQGPQHVAYSRWAALPATGYSTLPDEFWVWGDVERQAIEAWNANLPCHRVRLTGNFWLQQWFDDSDPQVADGLRQASMLRSASATKQVLVGMTWGVSAREDDKLIAAACLCGPGVAFWWRLHPVVAARHAEFAARLQRAGLDGRHVEPVTDLPLPALLRRADVVLSHSSTVVQEAAELGLPSVVTSAYGASLYADLVRRGTVLHAETPEAIAAAIGTLAARPRAARDPARPAQAGLQAAVDALLQLPATRRTGAAP